MRTQVCLMDMEYNLPVAVRDKLMNSAGADRGVGGVQMPTSDVNKEFYWENQRKVRIHALAMPTALG